MPSRALRHERINELIADYEVRSQHELQDLLSHEGIEVTQATLSRDLHQIGVVKGPQGYVVPTGTIESSNGDPDGLEATLHRELVGASAGVGMVILRTRPGHANAVAFRLDHARLEEIAGTIAGDDTIFVAVHMERQVKTLLRKIRTMAALPVV